MRMDAVIALILPVKLRFIGCLVKTNALVSGKSGWLIQKEEVSFLRKSISSFTYSILKKTALKEIRK